MLNEQLTTNIDPGLSFQCECEGWTLLPVTTTMISAHLIRYSVHCGLRNNLRMMVACHSTLQKWSTYPALTHRPTGLSIFPQIARTLYMKERTYVPKPKDDNLGEGYKLIYVNKSQDYITRVGFVSTVVYSVVFTAGIIYVVELIYKQVNLLQYNFVCGCAMASGIFLIKFLSHRVFRQIFLRIYYNEQEDQYIAVVRRNYYKDVQVPFVISDVKSNPDSYLGTTVTIKGFTYMVLATDFSPYSHFNRLMGYEADRDILKDRTKDIDLREQFRKMKSQRK